MNHTTTIGRTCGHCGAVDCTKAHRVMSIVYGAHALHCGVCHKAPERCECDVFMQWWAAHTVVTPVLCEFCKRTVTVCNADTQGCGSTPAEPEEPPAPAPKKVNESWRDRPPLL